MLGFAAYLSLTSQPKPADTFKVSIKQPATTPAMQRRVLPTTSPVPDSSEPVIEQARLPEQSPGSIPASASRHANLQFHSERNSALRLRSAVDSSTNHYASERSPALQGGGLANAGSTEASNLGPGLGVAASSNPVQPRTAVTAPTSEAAAASAPGSAILTPAGSVLLNGHPAINSTALFPGDQVQVPAGSYASINGNGSQAMLQPGSSVVFTGKAFELRQGRIGVSTSRGTPVATEGLSIIPRTSQAKYDVLDNQGSVQVASLAGDLSITGAAQPMTVATGQQTTIDKRKAAAPPPDSADAPSSAAAGHFPTAKVLLIGGAAAGGITAAVLLTRSSSKPVSPAVP